MIYDNVKRACEKRNFNFYIREKIGIFEWKYLQVE